MLTGDKVRARVKLPECVLTDEEFAIARDAAADLMDTGTEAGKLMALVILFGIDGSHSVESLRKVVDAAELASGMELEELRKRGLH